MRHIFSMLVLAGVVVVVAACSTPPYVHKSGEYNRASQGFGQPVNDISSVTVCYSSYSATPQQVSQLAVDECAAFNKTAQFSSQSYNVCPLAAPIAAIYNCLGSGNFADSGVLGLDGQSIPGETIMNYDGIQFRY
ncbi:MAG: hypothetical protein HQ513_13685 [Rhodospirillales bacterium]|nr:hypothetical protein [Rhodospirillales bacterium]